MQVSARGAIRVLAVDDHPTVLTGLDMVIAATPGLELCATATSGEEAIRAASQADPHICLVDVRLPGIDGIATTTELLKLLPAAAAVIYSARGDRRLLSDAIEAGARGYVLKSSPTEDLIRAIHSVAGGRPYVDPSLSPSLVVGLDDEEDLLGEREREVLSLLAAGLHTDQVAERIGLSRETVKADARRAVDRLGASGRVHAVATALRRELIE